jgi:hypothetical protein
MHTTSFTDIKYAKSDITKVVSVDRTLEEQEMYMSLRGLIGLVLRLLPRNIKRASAIVYKKTFERETSTQHHAPIDVV